MEPSSPTTVQTNSTKSADWSKKVIQGSDNASRREAAWSVRGGRANGWRKFLFDQNGDQLMSGCLNLEALQALVRPARAENLSGPNKHDGTNTTIICSL